MVPRTTLPLACQSGSGRINGAAFITVRHSTPSGGGQAGRPQAARRNTACTATQAMSNQGIARGWLVASSAS
eukprot:6206236-Pleurochrysis_carterae.AAC.3